METQITKNQVVRLIQNDLVNLKMTSYLSQIPIPADDYMLGLDELVFELMGIERFSDKRVDQIFRNYMARANKVMRMNLSIDQEAIEKLAEELYEYLEFETDLSFETEDQESDNHIIQ